MLTTVSNTLSLHDALPINQQRSISAHDEGLRITGGGDNHRRRCAPEQAPLGARCPAATDDCSKDDAGAGGKGPDIEATGRSEEHTSELKSHVNLVCRLLLE